MPQPFPPRPSLAAALLAVLAAACSSTEERPAESVNSLIMHGRYEEGVRRAARLAADRPGDAHAQEVHRRATMALLLHRGRQLTFQDRDVEALEIFREAAQVDPDAPEPKAWIDKTRHKLAERWLTQALELHASDKLDAAIEAYVTSLQYVPGERGALAGLGEAVVQANYRAGLGRSYYEEGIHALHEYWLEVARSKFSNAEKYQPEDTGTVKRREEVDALLAEQRVAVAQALEEEGRFEAARLEYRLALALDEDSPEALAGRERTDEEAEAAVLLRKAKLQILRGELDQAARMVEEGRARTKLQGDLFEGVQAAIDEARHERAYREALALERDGNFEAAVHKYAALLEQAPFYKDAVARRDTLQEYLRKAAELYSKAQAETDPRVRLEHLSKITLFWPEYLDVREQIQELQKQIGP